MNNKKIKNIIIDSYKESNSASTRTLSKIKNITWGYKKRDIKK